MALNVHKGSKSHHPVDKSSVTNVKFLSITSKFPYAKQYPAQKCFKRKFAILEKEIYQEVSQYFGKLNLSSSEKVDKR